MLRLAAIGKGIRDDIAAGRLRLGVRLTIDDLARRYGTSHVPISEALEELQGEGLIELEPNLGARVRPIDAAFLESLFRTRAAIEVLLVRQAAKLCTRADISLLQLIEAERLVHVAERDYRAALEANGRFHDAINAMARNPQAAAIEERQRVFIAACWHEFGYCEERFEGVASDHHNILLALAAHDDEAAAVLMGAHVIKAKFALLDRMWAAQRTEQEPTRSEAR